MKRFSIIPCALAILVFLSTALMAEEERSRSGMRYIIVKPAGYSPKKPMPILLLFHGAGLTPQQMMSNAGGINFKSKYILVYPYAPKNKSFEKEDIPMAADMVVELKEKYNPPYVISLGYSQGGYFGTRLALNYPLLISGSIACACGLPFHPITPDFQTDIHRRLAIALIVGSNDGPAKATEGKKDLEDAGYKYIFCEIVQGAGHVVHCPTVNKAHDWMMGVFKKGGGGGIVPWPKEKVEEAAKKAEEAAKEKKYDEALSALETLRQTGYIVDSRNSAPITSRFSALLESADKAEKLFALKAVAYAGEPGVTAIKKVLEASQADEEIYVAAVSALGKSGEAALETLHSIMAKNDFSYKPALAAVAALEQIGSRESVRPLINLLGTIEDKAAEAGGVLKDPINSALRKITGQNFTTSSAWKGWLK
jgi:predicted esterase